MLPHRLAPETYLRCDGGPFLCHHTTKRHDVAALELSAASAHRCQNLQQPGFSERLSGDRGSSNSSQMEHSDVGAPGDAHKSPLLNSCSDRVPSVRHEVLQATLRQQNVQSEASVLSGPRAFAQRCSEHCGIRECRKSNGQRTFTWTMNTFWLWSRIRWVSLMFQGFQALSE